MNVLDLFSGIGGFSLGLERAGFQTVAFCEVDPYCRSVLSRHWPDVPIHGSIEELDGEQYRGTVDVVCGGFPCQPFSVAGDRRGEADDRALWPEMLRVIRESRPTWVIGENVTGFISMGLDACLLDLANEGYRSRAFVIPACAVGAPHRRDRVWIVGNAHSHSQPTSALDAAASGIMGEAVAHTSSERLQGLQCAVGGEEKHSVDCEHIRWPTEPPVCESDDGFPRRVAALRALGNAVVPQIPEIIGKAIMEVERVDQK